MGLLAWIKRQFELDDEEDTLENSDNPKIVTGIRPAWFENDTKPSDQ